MIDLTKYNTLRVGAFAKDLVEINTSADFAKINIDEPFLFLGHGANVLFKNDFSGTIYKINTSGIKILKDSEDEVLVEIQAGQDWHELVMWSVNHNLSGMENMALIPGTVGAAAVGNIAAYGQNQGDIVNSVEVYDLQNKKLLTLNHDECGFVYRNSVFNKKYKNKFLITKVIYKLSRTAHFDIKYHSRYESLESELQKFATPPYTIKDVAQAVINIRKIKMPDWNVVGTAGSIFKNPFVDKTKLSQLQSVIPELQAYPTEKMLYPSANDKIFEELDLVKIPAGRLLDQLGWRNKRIGNVGTFDKHALVVVNYGEGSGQKLFEFTEMMRADVKEKFAVDLEYEVQII